MNRIAPRQQPKAHNPPYPEEFIKSVVRNVVQGTEIDDIDEPF
jgi:hypothetical protein